MNKCFISGNLVAEPEKQTTGSGLSYCRITLAIKRKYANAKNEYETDFIGVVAWRSTAEYICKYFHKGNKIGIVGSLQTRSWTDKNDNVHNVTEVLAEEVETYATKQIKTELDKVETALPF